MRILKYFVLQYKNVRPDYVKAIFDVANWKDVAARSVGLLSQQGKLYVLTG